MEERAALAAELLASLDGEPDAEVERRAKRLLSGEDQGHSWEDVRARLKAEFGR